MNCVSKISNSCLHDLGLISNNVYRSIYTIIPWSLSGVPLFNNITWSIQSHHYIKSELWINIEVLFFTWCYVAPRDENATQPPWRDHDFVTICAASHSLKRLYVKMNNIDYILLTHLFITNLKNGCLILVSVVEDFCNVAKNSAQKKCIIYFR